MFHVVFCSSFLDDKDYSYVVHLLNLLSYFFLHSWVGSVMFEPYKDMYSQPYGL